MSVSAFAAGCAILFAILGTVGNLWTILALLRSRKLRENATSWFVISLCFSDFLFCIINLPLTASRYIYEAWIFDEGVLCKIFPFFFYSNFGVSLLSIALIAINRYVLISHFKVYRQIYSSLLHVSCMIGFVWLFSFGLMLFPLVEVWGSLGLDKGTFSCTILKKEGSSPKKFLFIFGILMPCVIIVFCYVKIFLTVRKSKASVTSHNSASESNRNERQKRAEIRLTRIMFSIFVFYIVSFMPLMFLNVLDDETRKVSSAFHTLASILAWSSAFVNPFIYAVSNRQYRKAYWELIPSFLLCNKGEEGNNRNNCCGNVAGISYCSNNGKNTTTTTSSH